MYNTCYRIVQNPDEAEELMHESFLHAFAKINTFRGEGTFGSWLKKIAVNKSVDFIRKAKPEIVSLDEFKQEPVDSVEDYDANADSSFYDMNKVVKAMDSLPDNYRVILSLYLLEGYDHSEISEILNISNANVRVRYVRAKKKLKESLSESVMR